MDGLKDKPGVVSLIEPEFRTFSIKLNTEYGPLTDLNLRKAISYAKTLGGNAEAVIADWGLPWRAADYPPPRAAPAAPSH
mgnify:CR=1 FL=1